jgi:stage II sporulation protein D
VVREQLSVLASTLRPMNRRASLLVVAAGCALILVRCTTPRPLAPAPEVQVLLERGANEVRVGLDGAYVVADERGNALANGQRLVGGRIRDEGRGLELNGVALEANALVIHPTDRDLFHYAGRSYSGDLRVRRAADGRLEVANVIDVEEYLAGVLFSEMPASFPEAALRAQVVAARTYARWRLSHGDPLLRATDADQVYGGATALRERALSLVAATRGLVLEIDGEPLPAYFMSTCGGATVDAPRVFSGAPRQGLAGVKCEWCAASPRYRWSRSVATPELERRLGLPIGSVSAITAERDHFGHSLAFEVTTGGRARTFEGQEFRRLWNAGAGSDAEKLPSAWFQRIDLSRATLAVDGAGFGHGVGLCQYGAAGLAKAGHDWREILRFYYGGAELVKRW